MPITCQPQANFLYTLFLIFINICKAGVKYSTQSAKVLKKKTFGEETKGKNKQSHETNEKTKQNQTRLSDCCWAGFQTGSEIFFSRS